MNELNLSILIFVNSIFVGILGALSGLGGGAILSPILFLFFGVELRYAMGSALIASIATSSGSAAAYVKDGYSNVRIGMFLELATTFGAIGGAHLMSFLPRSALCFVFSLIMLLSAYLSIRPAPEEATEESKSDPLADRLGLNGTYPQGSELVSYKVRNVKGGFLMMLFAGGISGLLGIGSGPLKVLAMDQIMRIPFKVSTTTSNFMIGVTAAASAGIYMRKGYIDPLLSVPVMLGVLCGSLLGASILPKANTGLLRKVFAALICLIALQMLFKAFEAKF